MLYFVFLCRNSDLVICVWYNLNSFRQCVASFSCYHCLSIVSLYMLNSDVDNSHPCPSNLCVPPLYLFCFLNQCYMLYYTDSIKWIVISLPLNISHNLLYRTICFFVISKLCSLCLQILLIIQIQSSFQTSFWFSDIITSIIAFSLYMIILECTLYLFIHYEFNSLIPL